MLKNRVLASFGALFACGAAVAVYLENYIPLFLFLVAGVLCGYLCIARLLRRKPRIRRTLAYAAAPLLAIAFTLVYRALFITPYYALDGVAVKGAGTVVEVREYAAGGYLEVEIEEADTPLAEGLTVRLYLADGANLPACGFTVEFEATLRVPENGTGMAADRVLLVGTQAKLRSVWYPSGALWKLRYAVSRDIEEMYGQFGKEVPAVIKATVVNNTTALRTTFTPPSAIPAPRISSPSAASTFPSSLCRFTAFYARSAWAGSPVRSSARCWPSSTPRSSALRRRWCARRLCC